MLTKADFGLAAVFTMTISFLEIIGRLSLGAQIIQSREGDSEVFQGTSHVFQFFGGLASGILLILLAIPFSHAFKLPSVAWAFACLSIVPISKGLQHLDVDRLQRNLNFLPGILYELIPQIIITIAVWPLARWLGDFRVIIWIMAIKALSNVLFSHFFSERRYSWSWHPQYAKQILSFGWPLLLNGLLLFFAQQADQFLIGSAFDLATLASYAVATMLVSVPREIFTQVMRSMALPLFSKVQDEKATFIEHYRTSFEITALIGLGVFIPLVVFGDIFVTTLYGDKYVGTGKFISILALAVLFRFLRFTSNMAAMAKGDTINMLITNIWRAIGFPLAYIIVLVGGEPIHIAICSVIGEILALIASLIRITNKQSMPMKSSLYPVFFTLAFVISIYITMTLIPTKENFWWAVLVVSVFLSMVLKIGFKIFPQTSILILRVLPKDYGVIPWKKK